MKVIYLGAGGFWTTEAIFGQVRGVTEIIPGYMGGDTPNPTHDAVATGMTGHAEVVKIVYDEAIVGLGELLDVFFAMHDPSTPAHIGKGVGSQYRSVIFYTDTIDAEDIEHKSATGSAVGIIQQKVASTQAALPEGSFVATQVVSATEFYPADESHYNFYSTHPEAAYAVTIIAPKLQEVRQRFPQKFK